MKATYLSLIVIFLLGCDRGGSKTPIENQIIVPKTLEDNSSTRLYSSNRGSLIDNIYHEILSMDQDLKELAKDLENRIEESENIVQKKQDFLQKNEAYYQEALSIIESFESPELKEEIGRALENSRANYSTIEEAQKSQNEQIDSLVALNMEYQAAIKILYTLPYMEAFQQGRIPSEEDFKKQVEILKELIDKQRILLEE
jgi:hypothetical protein